MICCRFCRMLLQDKDEGVYFYCALVLLLNCKIELPRPFPFLLTSRTSLFFPNVIIVAVLTLKMRFCPC